MNYQKAQRIVELHKHLEKPIQDERLHSLMELAIHQYLQAKGFLLCYAKAEKLVEALEKQLDSCAYPKMDCAVCKQGHAVLDQWHKENKEGE